MIHLREIDHLVLRVRDLDRMLAFYCDVLGCRVERRQEAIGLVQLRAGRSLVDLVPADGTLGRRGGAPPGPEGRNLDHLCFRVDPFDGDAIRAHLAARGLAAGEVSSRYGAEGVGPSIYVEDPEGNTVELKGPRPDGDPRAAAPAAAVPMGGILWRRLDRPGHETARLVHAGDGWRLAGAAVFVHEGRPCRLDYLVVCDAAWRTVATRVTGWIGERTVAIDVAADTAGRWRLDGRDCPAVAGCLDVDLNFSPSTNLLPIRRLGLGPGQSAGVRAAWLRFPSFALEPLEQTYRRLDTETYRYESAGGCFVADLRVDSAGFVTHYPGVWEVEAGAEAHHPRLAPPPPLAPPDAP